MGEYTLQYTVLPKMGVGISLKIVLKNLKVENVSYSSGIFSGDNLQIDWKSYKKINEGFGAMLGSGNNFFKNRHIVQKPDFEDQNTSQDEQQ